METNEQNNYPEAIKWLYNHQHPSLITNEMNIVTLSHPRGDGDGLATRIGRLVGRIVSHILKGDIVILTGGFRGYTHPETGFESLFEPFSNIKAEIDGTYIIPNDNFQNNDHFVWEKSTPLFSKGEKWWYGVILNYFTRPNTDLQKYIDSKMERLGILRLKYIGMHVRRGDNSVGLKYGFEDYYKVLNEEVLPFWKENDTNPIPIIYLATDSSEILSRFSDKKLKSRSFSVAFEKTTSLDMSCPGSSAANTMIRNEKNAEFVMKVAFEVVADIILLSNSCFLVGIMTSQITKIAAAMAHVRGNVVHIPIALDYDIRIEWVKSNTYEMYNGDITPFVRPQTV